MRPSVAWLLVFVFYGLGLGAVAMWFIGALSNWSNGVIHPYGYWESVAFTFIVTLIVGAVLAYRDREQN